ncbi:MAG: sigma-70 family RNA polymerase sigma factor [Opitutus sp.]
MTNDELLDRYVNECAESAFADLVKRHLNLVYSTALRHVRSPHLAEEVAQSVFIDLARQGGRIKAGTPLIAWLHLVARRTAIDAVRKESRRRANESSAAHFASNAAPVGDEDTPWSELEPLVDDAVNSLNPIDRSAILLRFFEDRSFQEVARLLGSTDDAAQKRVSRALERIRDYLTRRGVQVTAAGLSSGLATHAMQTAPATLHAAITSAAVSKAALLSALTRPLAEIAMTTTQKLIAGTIFAAAIAGGIYEVQRNLQQEAELKDLRARAASAEQDLRLLREQRDASMKALQQTSEALAAERSKTALFASQDNEAESALDGWLQRVVSMRRFLKEHPQYQIPELSLLEEKDWLDATKEAQLEDEWDFRSAADTLRRLAANRLFQRVMPAVSRYLKKSNGVPPNDPSQLAEFMDKPFDATFWARYKIIPAAEAEPNAPIFSVPNGKKATWLLTDKAAVDDYYTSKIYVSEYGVGTTMMMNFDKEVWAARGAFQSANPNQRPTTAAQLAPYLKVKVDPSFVEKLLKKAQ